MILTLLASFWKPEVPERLVARKQRFFFFFFGSLYPSDPVLANAYYI